MNASAYVLRNELASAALTGQFADLQGVPSALLQGTGTSGALAQFAGTTELSASMVTQLNNKIGVGVAEPASTLHVAGSVQVGADPSSCSAIRTGALRWNGAALQLCESNLWRTVYPPAAQPTGGILSFPVITTSYASTSTAFAYNQYYGNVALSATVYSDMLATYGGTSVQIKLVAVGHLAPGASETICNVRVKEYSSGSVFGTWSGTYTNATDNIAIETPWTTITPVSGVRGYRFEMGNTAGRTFTLYNATMYLRTQ